MTDLKRKTFSERLARDELIVAPGMYDMVSAKLADLMASTACT